MRSGLLLAIATAASLVVGMGGVAAAVESVDTSAGVAADDPPRAAIVAREGQLLPETISAAIGHKQVLGVFLGGYDSAVGQGPAFSAVVEGQLFGRVALRAGVDYQDAIHNVYPSVGLRVGILKQERQRVDVAVIGQYKNLGFSEASGELEFGVAVGHRWAHLGVVADALYGQGLDPHERDIEGRAALLYFAHPRVNVGLDVRARADLGADSPARQKAQLQADFDLLAGATASLVVMKHLVLLAEVGPHVVVIQEHPSAGVAALGGLGATY
jgi:hypothetical protein